jgi:hypothetical protein
MNLNIVLDINIVLDLILKRPRHTTPPLCISRAHSPTWVTNPAIFR